MSTSVALGPDTDVTHAELCLSGDEPCSEVVDCDECDRTVCAEHDDNAVICVASAYVAHHSDCAQRCPECCGAGEQDLYEDRYELAWRGGDR